MRNFKNEMENLTKELVKIPSINNTSGEVDIANKIHGYIHGLEYFKKNKQYLWQQKLKNDPLGRFNVIALIRGEKSPSNKTIILHGHTDTVGVEDFGELAAYAFDPDALEEKLKERRLDKELEEDLMSGDWMFGRGTNDMKAGLAVHLILFEEISKHVDKLSGNIIFMCNPVEENQHTGIIEAIDLLEELKIEEKLEYVVAINNDYTTAMSPNDTNRYIYLGAVGKLLPCYYIVGKETHVGQCFEGLDPNLIAAELVRLINLNSELCDEYGGEYTLPPAALKLTDLKKDYNVQTPLESYVYFNYFLHDISVEEVTDILLKKGEIAFANVKQYLEKQYLSYCTKTSQPYVPLKWKQRVTKYEDLYSKVKGKLGEELDLILNEMTEKMKAEHRDPRAIGLELVKKVKALSGDGDPEVILFYSPPYCPHNTLKEDNKELIKMIQKTADIVGKEYGETIKLMQFFPSLSDSSYLKIDDEESSIHRLINNFPSYQQIYNVPVKRIKKMNIPAVNFGTYGKDAHKSTERVYKPYTFEVLPRLILTTIETILEFDVGVNKNEKFI